MANRGYLYPCDEVSVELGYHGYIGIHGDDRHPCYVSRHSIAASWFGFFRTVEVRRVRDKEHGFIELLCVAPKAEALALFLQRAKLLEEILIEETSRTAATEMLSDMESWPGEYLVMDPVEVLQGSKKDCELILENVLKALERGGRADIATSLKPIWSMPSDPEMRVGSVVGYSWG